MQQPPHQINGRRTAMEDSLLQDRDSSRDGDQIDVGDEAEIERRCRKWGCTRVQLKIAAREAHSLRVDKIERYLKAQGWHK
jgi:hypothetical protein